MIFCLTGMRVSFIIISRKVYIRPGYIPSDDSSKNPHAVALGRLGGLKGGKARAEKLDSGKIEREQVTNTGSLSI